MEVKTGATLSTGIGQLDTACPPSPSVTVNVTRKLPSSPKVWETTSPEVSGEPSPQLQSYWSTSSGPGSVATAPNETDCPSLRSEGSAWLVIVGSRLATTTEAVSSAVTPSSSVTTRRAVKAPSSS